MTATGLNWSTWRKTSSSAILPNENTDYSDNSRKSMDHLTNSLKIYIHLHTLRLLFGDLTIKFPVIFYIILGTLLWK